MRQEMVRLRLTRLTVRVARILGGLDSRDGEDAFESLSPTLLYHSGHPPSQTHHRHYHHHQTPAAARGASRLLLQRLPLALSSAHAASSPHSIQCQPSWLWRLPSPRLPPRPRSARSRITRTLHSPAVLLFNSCSTPTRHASRACG